ncbi:MAG TPA: protein kinase [Polyangiaceae bacterium]|nr:protein kinase [Polyangiaceae bacterium]
MTHRAPRSTEEELVDTLSAEASPERSVSGVAPSLVAAVAASEPPAEADEAAPVEIVSRELQLGVEEHSPIELQPDAELELEPRAGAEPTPEEPSSRELTGAELASSEQLDALEGLAASSVGEPAPISESEEVTSDQLIQDGEAPPVPIESAPSGPYQPIRAGSERPWVDQVADPVTPYEQRVSELVRVADLPPVEQVRGRVLANRYLAEELAEQSSASLSYRSYHLALDSAVTVRILPRGLACSDELCQEVRSAARVATQLEHPNLAATLDFGVTTDGWPFLVTENLQGRSLAGLLAEEGKFVLRRVLHIGKQLAAGLSAAHQAGLVHGLLNPDKVLVIEPGTSAEIATIIGFGVNAARGAAPTPPRSGVFGVPSYVSPEQAACRELDARSDIYSLGVLLYELMTGAPPFVEGDFAAVLCQHLDDDPEPPSARLPSPGALAKAMDAIIERCLRKEPEQRYQTAAELAEDLIRLEAAAARNKRRPMPEIARPTTTIHSPPPRADSSHGAQEQKVIVHAPEDTPDAEAGDSPGEARASSPGATPGAPAAAARKPATAPPRGPHAAAPTVIRRPPRVSVDQATIKISALDRELAMALHRHRQPNEVRQSWNRAGQGLTAALIASLALLWQWVVRLFGGGAKAAAPQRDSKP